MNNAEKDPIRRDFELIARLVPENAKILDVGCGDGALMTYLRTQKNADTRGLEISVSGVQKCVNAGHSVVQGDADADLENYPDNAFDVVILTKTIQATQRPDEVIKQITRIGKKAVVGFTNFGHYSVILDLLLRKRMPLTKTLPISWYETPNIHFCTIKDFSDLVSALGLKIESHTIIDKKGRVMSSQANSYRSNLFGAMGIFTLSSD